MEYGRCRFVSVRNILQQLDGSEVTVLRNHVVHPHTAVLLRQYLCLAVKSLLLQQPPQYREVARIEETRTFFHQTAGRNVYQTPFSYHQANTSGHQKGDSADQQDRT